MSKGAYDLGRKAVYYIVVVIIIAILFAYVTNSFRQYQITRLSNLDQATDLVIVNNVIKCVSQEDPETKKIVLGNIDESLFNEESLNNCLGKEEPYADKAIKLELGEEYFETQEPFFEYNKYEKKVNYKGEMKELKISIEKYPELT